MTAKKLEMIQKGATAFGLFRVESPSACEAMVYTNDYGRKSVNPLRVAFAHKLAAAEVMHETLIQAEKYLATAKLEPRRDGPDTLSPLDAAHDSVVAALKAAQSYPTAEAPRLTLVEDKLS